MVFHITYVQKLQVRIYYTAACPSIVRVMVFCDLCKNQTRVPYGCYTGEPMLL